MLEVVGVCLERMPGSCKLDNTKGWVVKVIFYPPEICALVLDTLWSTVHDKALNLLDFPPLD